jgi:hypothetical protein
MIPIHVKTPDGTIRTVMAERAITHKVTGHLWLMAHGDLVRSFPPGSRWGWSEVVEVRRAA